MDPFINHIMLLSFGGEFEFKGVLTEFTIDYKLFNNDGPLLEQ